MDHESRLVAWSGEIDRPFFLRSSAKPFQAAISLEAGASLEPSEIALASSSHDGDPVHIAIVRRILERAGLTEDDLQCPPNWPLGVTARHRLIGSGHQKRSRIWHNCSGKHAAWLAACQARGWPIETYLDPEHPLQVKIQDFVSKLGDYPTGPVGVDGCGAPVLRTTVRAMAVMFSRLGTDNRLSEVFQAMHRFPSLVSGVGNGDASIAIATNSAAKRGALGCIGIAVHQQFGVAAKSWDGSDQVAAMAAAVALKLVGGFTPAIERSLSDVTGRLIEGGGQPVGRLEPHLELQWSRAE